MQVPRRENELIHIGSLRTADPFENSKTKEQCTGEANRVCAIAPTDTARSRKDEMQNGHWNTNQNPE
jgi:hypothetical protein